jgi:hypothetical protein
MALDDIISLLSPVVKGLGVDSAKLTADEEQRIRQLAGEIKKIYDAAVARYKAGCPSCALETSS